MTFSEYSIIYVQDAINDLKSIYTYVAFQICEPQTAKQLLKKLITKIDSLSTFPLRHQRFTTISQKEIRQIVVKNYVVLYEVDEKMKVVTIIAVANSKRNLKEIIN